MLSQYLAKDDIRCRVSATDWRSAIRLAAEPLEEAGKIETSYVERTIQKVEELGPYIVLAKGLAVAHARPKDDVKAESISLITLKDAVVFGHETNDPVSIVFLIAATNDDGHIAMVMDVAQKLCEENMKEKIIAAQSAEEIYCLVAK